MKTTELPPVLAGIKPEYPHLVAYSAPGEGFLFEIEPGKLSSACLAIKDEKLEL
jgi:hypothetical protein